MTGIVSVRIVVLAEPPPTARDASPGGSKFPDCSFSEGAGPKARAFFFAPLFSLISGGSHDQACAEADGA